MSPIELYLASMTALAHEDLATAQKILPELAEKLDALCGRGWHKLELTGDETTDVLIEKTNRHLTG